jgi:hypothetical protein
MDEKTRENRLRRMAERQGYRLQKSRQRDPRGYLYGTYQLTDFNNVLVLADFAYGRGYGVSLDEVEEWLTKEER